MHKSARLSAILEQLATGNAVDVSGLAKELGASPATIRRDLATLERQRLLERTHGGAVAHAVSYELPLRYKGVRFAEEKRRIAAAAAGRVTEGMAVGLTGGTTATEVARAKGGTAPSTPAAASQLDRDAVEQLMVLAHRECLNVLRSMIDPEQGTSFAFKLVTLELLMRCEDTQANSGWLPIAKSNMRLADRVQSLIAVDFLTRPEDYEAQLAICSRCGTIEFDAMARARGLCRRHSNNAHRPRRRRWHTLFARNRPRQSFPRPRRRSGYGVDRRRQRLRRIFNGWKRNSHAAAEFADQSQHDRASGRDTGAAS